jgi:hypothetical protein
MSKITLVSPASGTAEFSITTPSGTSTDRTLTLPDAGGTVVSDTAPQTLTNKTLTTPNIDSAQFATVTGTAPLYAARAWVNFDGTGTPAIRASGNVSSITDNGTADYTVNFTTAMPDANYGILGTAQASSSNNSAAETFPLVTVYSDVSPTTSSARVFVRSARQAYGTADYPSVYVGIFR